MAFLTRRFPVGPSFPSAASTPYAGWTPNSVNSVFWYDFSAPGGAEHDLSTLSQVNDLSGNGRHLFQIGTGTATWSTQGIFFNGSGGVNPVLSTVADVVLSQPFTIILAIEAFSTQGVFATLFHCDTVYFFSSYIGPPTMLAGSTLALGSTALVSGQKVMLMGTFTGASSIGWLDGNAVGVGNAGTQPLNYRVQFGAEGSGNEFKGWLKGAICFPGVDGVDTSASFNYMQKRWGFP